MSTSLKELLFAILALGTGAALTLAVGRQMAAPSNSLHEAEVKFENLDPVQQENLRNKATAYLGPTGDESLRRIEAIHAAVDKDPELQEKVDRLLTLLETADEETRFQLRPNGKFADNWVELIEKIDQRPARQPLLEIELPFSGDGKRETLVLTETQVDAFLLAAIPSPVPDDLTKRLASFTAPENNAERALVRSLWILRQLMTPPDKERSTDKDRLFKLMLQAAEEHLIPEQYLQQFQSAVQINAAVGFLRPENGPRGGGAGFMLLRLMSHIIRHYESAFREHHVSDLADAAELFETERTREQQLALMRGDPDDAARALVKSANPAIDELISDLQRSRPWLRIFEGSTRGPGSRFGRGSFQGGPRGEEGSDRDSGPPREPGRFGGSEKPRNGDRGDRTPNENGERFPPNEKRPPQSTR